MRTFAPDAIKLDANENPYPPLVEGALAASVNRYPEPQPQRLKASLAALYGVASENLVITRGADDAIDMLVRTFCRPDIDAVAVCTPSFSAYAHFVKLQGARLVEVPLNADFDFDAGSVHRSRRRRRESQARLHLHAQQSDRERSRPAADPARRRCAAGDDHRRRRGLSRFLRRCRASPAKRRRAANLVVLKTLSKAFGLAGARVGCAIGEPS